MYIHAGMWKAFVTVLSTVGSLCIAVLLAENIQRPWIEHGARMLSGAARVAHRARTMAARSEDAIVCRQVGGWETEERVTHDDLRRREYASLPASLVAS